MRAVHNNRVLQQVLRRMTLRQKRRTLVEWLDYARWDLRHNARWEAPYEAGKLVLFAVAVSVLMSPLIAAIGAVPPWTTPTQPCCNPCQSSDAGAPEWN